MQDLDQIRSHLFDRLYMSGVERDQNRIKATGEVFTPDGAVADMLQTLPADYFADPARTVLDPACGDGQWLARVLWLKLMVGIEFKTALMSLFGVDIMEDNVTECRRRLLCGREDLRGIVERNIICRNSLEYDFSFNGTNMTNQELDQFIKQQRYAQFGLPTDSDRTSKKQTKKQVESSNNFGDLFPQIPNPAG